MYNPKGRCFRAVKNDYDLQLEYENNSYTQIIRRIPRGSAVLELGCATGHMSRYLREELNCQVVGVDIDPEAVRKAEAACDRVIRADVEATGWLAALGKERFDVITCADLIEYLRRPKMVLGRLQDYLKPDGFLLASIPNGAHTSLRLELLAGQITYEDTGLLDRTHFRFYTHRSICSLCAEAGFRVEELSYTFRDIPDEVIRKWLKRVGLQPNDQVLAYLHAPDAAAYQFIVVARPRREGDITVIPELTEKPLQDSMEVYRNLHDELHQTTLVLRNKVKIIEERDRMLADLSRLLHSQQTSTRVQETQLKRLKIRFKLLGHNLRESGGHLAKADRQLVNLRRTLNEQQETISEQHRRHEALKRDLAEHSDALRSVLHSTGWRVYMTMLLPVRIWRKLKPHVSRMLRNPRTTPDWVHQAWRQWRAEGARGLIDHLVAPVSSTSERERETQESSEQGAAGQALHGGDAIESAAPNQYYSEWTMRHERLRRGEDVGPAPPSQDYSEWIARHETLSTDELRLMNAFIQGLEAPPLISIVMPVYDVAADWFRQAIESVNAQSYPHWELCIADDASTAPHIRPMLSEYVHRDRRIKVVLRDDNGHIAAASNSALELASGDYVGFLDHDDLLAPHALYFMVLEITKHPDARLIYSDEDKIDRKGVRFVHNFKPDYNPDLMCSHNMIGHFALYQRELLHEVGGFREGFEGAQHYDLALRIISRIEPSQIRHISRILYHWRVLPESTALGSDTKPNAMKAAIRSVSEFLTRHGEPARVTESPLIEGMLRVSYPIPDNSPLVSIIIPTKNGLELLRRCLGSLQKKTTYTPFEIIVVDNNSDDLVTLGYLAQLEKVSTIQVLRYPEPFNFSAINNFAVAHCRGEVLAFLNNDIEVINHGWLTEMVSQALRPEIGAVGARLWYPNDWLQHGGVVLGLGGIAGHAMKYLPGIQKGYNGRAVVVQNYSAVTAACLVIRREVFEQVDGFDEVHLSVAFNDVDFCLRVLEQGYRNLWTPFAELYHHESASRGAEDTVEKQARFSAETDYMKQRWGALLQHDPAYNPNLTLDREDFSLRD